MTCEARRIVIVRCRRDAGISIPTRANGIGPLGTMEPRNHAFSKQPPTHTPKHPNRNPLLIGAVLSSVSSTLYVFRCDPILCDIEPANNDGCQCAKPLSRIADRRSRIADRFVTDRCFLKSRDLPLVNRTRRFVYHRFRPFHCFRNAK